MTTTQQTTVTLVPAADLDAQADAAWAAGNANESNRLRHLAHAARMLGA